MKLFYNVSKKVLFTELMRGYDYYIYRCSDNVELNKLGEVLVSKGFNVYKTAFNDGLQISWE